MISLGKLPLRSRWSPWTALKHLFLEAFMALLCGIVVCVVLILRQAVEKRPPFDSIEVSTIADVKTFLSPWSYLGVKETWKPGTAGECATHHFIVPITTQNETLWYSARKTGDNEFTRHMVGIGGNERLYRESTKFCVVSCSDAETFEVILSPKGKPEHWVSYKDLDGDARIDIWGKGVGRNVISREIMLRGQWIHCMETESDGVVSVIDEDGAERKAILRQGIWQYSPESSNDRQWEPKP